YYQIPYRCLTPKGMTNLLIAARSISTDVRMHSSVRIMPPVMNIGQAAGLAAAMSLPAGDVRKIDIKTLQDKIRHAGGILEPELHPVKPEIA
ncbi:MAG: FAD-dependent oxidoreductase, partial [Planctomycetaceae bacterium]